MKTIREPRYRQIAYAIAEKIADGDYPIGSKLHARSTLSAQFGVSSETARKAISILSDLDIVQAVHGSGVKILSQEKAKNFLNQAEETSTIQTLHVQIDNIMTVQKTAIENLSESLATLFEQTARIQKKNPLAPHELLLSETCDCIGQSISQLNFWQTTGATIVAILHNDELVLSPGPYAILEKNDTIYFVGNETIFQNVKTFFYPPLD